jgi:hypothetical protein
MRKGSLASQQMTLAANHAEHCCGQTQDASQRLHVQASSKQARHRVQSSTAVQQVLGLSQPTLIDIPFGVPFALAKLTSASAA